MNQSLIIVLLVVVVIGLGGLLYFQRHRSEKLRSKFGPEYDRAVKDSGDKSKAEAKAARA